MNTQVNRFIRADALYAGNIFEYFKKENFRLNEFHHHFCNVMAKSKPYFFLILDDKEDDHRLLKRAIKHIFPSAFTLSFFDGIDMVDYLVNEDEDPDLIFLDLQMGIVDGKETLRHLKSNKRFSRIPVAVFTSAHYPGEKEEVMNMGAQFYYAKPYHTVGYEDVLKKIETERLKKNDDQSGKRGEYLE